MNVLIAVDLEAGSQEVVERTLKLLDRALGTVWLLHVAAPDPDFVGYKVDPTVMRDQVAESYHREHRQLQEMAESVRAQGFAATALLVQGEWPVTLAKQAEKLGVDLIVLGHRQGGGFFHQLFSHDLGQNSLLDTGKPVLTVPLFT